MRNTKVFLLIVLVFFVSPVADAQAIMWNLPTAQNVKIDMYGKCRIVTNNSGKAISIPANTATEWTNFINSSVANVSKNYCTCTDLYEYNSCVENPNCTKALSTDEPSFCAGGSSI